MSEMSLERAVQVMNSNKHRDLDSWKLFHRSEAEVEVYSPENQYWWFSPDEAIAIAERYTHLAAPPAELSDEDECVVLAYAVEEVHDDATLARYARMRPDLAGEFVATERELARDEPPADGPVEDPGAEEAWQEFRAAALGMLKPHAAPPAERAGGRPEGQLFGNSEQLGEAEVAAGYIRSVVDGLPDGAKVIVKGEADYPVSTLSAGILRALLAAAERRARAEAGPATRELLEKLVTGIPVGPLSDEDREAAELVLAAVAENQSAESWPVVGPAVREVIGGLAKLIRGAPPEAVRIELDDRSDYLAYDDIAAAARELNMEPPR